MSSKLALNSRRKKVELGTLQQKTRKPILQEHTSKMEQKLAKLRMEVEQKKNATHKNRFSAQISSNNKKLKQYDKQKTATGSRPLLKQRTVFNGQNNIRMEDDLQQFLVENALTQYCQILLQNGVDSIPILEQINQKQLEQIGISKGHALKIIVKLKKKQKKQDKKLISNTNFSKDQNQPKKEKVQLNPPLQIIVQTEPVGQQGHEKINNKRRYFCLYCYKVNDGQFCNEDCQFYYNKMFEKYEKNLAKAEQNFGKASSNIKQQEEQREGQEGQDIDFLSFMDDSQTDSFDKEQYEEALKMIQMPAKQDPQ